MKYCCKRNQLIELIVIDDDDVTLAAEDLEGLGGCSAAASPDSLMMDYAVKYAVGKVGNEISRGWVP